MSQQNKQLVNTVLVAALLFLLYDWMNGGGSVIPSPPEPPLIERDGVAVLIIRQDSEEQGLTEDQKDVIAGFQWTAYVPDDNWRVADLNVEFTGGPEWEAAFNNRPPDVPGCMISGPGKQYSGPLPETITEMVEKVQAADG